MLAAQIFSSGAKNERFQSPKVDTSLEWKPGADIIVINEGQKIKTNVAISCSVAACIREFSWGYDGSGPSSLAENILNQFVPPGKDGFAPVKLRDVGYPDLGDRNVMSKTAYVLHREFERDFLSKSKTERSLILEMVGELQNDPESDRAKSLVEKVNTLRISGKEIEKWISDRLLTVKQAIL